MQLLIKYDNDIIIYINSIIIIIKDLVIKKRNYFAYYNNDLLFPKKISDVILLIIENIKMCAQYFPGDSVITRDKFVPEINEVVPEINEDNHEDDSEDKRRIYKSKFRIWKIMFSIFFLNYISKFIMFFDNTISIKIKDRSLLLNNNMIECIKKSRYNKEYKKFILEWEKNKEGLLKNTITSYDKFLLLCIKVKETIDRLILKDTVRRDNGEQSLKQSWREFAIIREQDKLDKIKEKEERKAKVLARALDRALAEEELDEINRKGSGNRREELYEAPVEPYEEEGPVEPYEEEENQLKEEEDQLIKEEQQRQEEQLIKEEKQRQEEQQRLIHTKNSWRTQRRFGTSHPTNIIGKSSGGSYSKKNKYNKKRIALTKRRRKHHNGGIYKQKTRRNKKRKFKQ